MIESLKNNVSLQQKSSPFYTLSDSALLHILEEKPGRAIFLFEKMLKNSTPDLLFSFLDENATFFNILRMGLSFGSDIPLMGSALLQHIPRFLGSVEKRSI